MPDRPTLTNHIGGVLLRHGINHLDHIDYVELRDSLTAVAWAYCDVDAYKQWVSDLQDDLDTLDRRVLDLEAENADLRARLEQIGVEA